MPITKITPYTVDSTQNFTFNNVTATGNLVSLNANLGNLVTANFFTGNGSLLTGITATADNANYANFAGTVITNAQPNITSVGTLISLTVNSGNLTANTGNVIFGNVGNVKITGGTANYVLSTDGTGNLDWVAQSGGGGGGGASNARVLGYSLIFGG